MSYSDVIYESEGRLATITLNRPEKLNALSNNLRGELMEAMRDAEADSEVGVIILNGAGRLLSARHDLFSVFIGSSLFSPCYGRAGHNTASELKKEDHFPDIERKDPAYAPNACA